MNTLLLADIGVGARQLMLKTSAKQITVVAPKIIHKTWRDEAVHAGYSGDLHLFTIREAMRLLPKSEVLLIEINSTVLLNSFDKLRYRECVVRNIAYGTASRRIVRFFTNRNFKVAIMK